MISAFGVEDSRISKADKPFRKTTIVYSQAADRDIDAGAPETRVYANRRRVKDEPTQLKVIREQHRRVLNPTFVERTTGTYKIRNHHFGPRKTHAGWNVSEYRPLLKRPRVQGAAGVATVGAGAAAVASSRRKDKR